MMPLISIDKAIARTLHGIQPATLLLLDEIDLAHVSLANQFDLVETRRADLDIPDLDGVGTVRPPERQRRPARRRQRRQAIAVRHAQRHVVAIALGLDQAQRAVIPVLYERLLAQFRRGRTLAAPLALGKETLGIWRASHPPQLPSQLLLGGGGGLLCRAAVGAVDLELGRIGRRWGHGALVVVAEGGRALVGKVGVRVRGRAQGLVERVALAGGGGAAEAADGGEELGLAEGGLVIVLGVEEQAVAVLGGGCGALFAVEAGDAEEVLQLLGEMAVAIGGFGGGHRRGGVGVGIMRLVRTTMPS